jgi:hypothetical protein
MFVSDVLKNTLTTVTVTVVTSVGFWFWAIFAGWVVLKTRNAQKLVTFYLYTVIPPVRPGDKPTLSFWPFREDAISEVVNNRYLAKQILSTAKFSPDGDPILRFPEKTRSIILDAFLRRSKMAFPNQALLRDQQQSQGETYLMFLAYEKTVCACRTQLKVVLVRPEILALFMPEQSLDFAFEHCRYGECVQMLRTVARCWQLQKSAPLEANHFREICLLTGAHSYP